MIQSSFQPIIGISMGDPAGIGPEILVKALSDPKITQICRPLVFGDTTIIQRAVDLCNESFTIHICRTTQEAVSTPATINIIDFPDHRIEPCDTRTQTAKSGSAMQAYIISGVHFALKKQISALVTCPITKTAMKLAGSKFHGHTELLAHHTQTDQYAMMLAGDRLRVVLVTIHIPLSKVSESLDTHKISDTIQLTYESLKSRFGIERPRIAVAGLNPHSGEDNMFGSEEEKIIRPAIKKSEALGMDITGPLPPDTVFYKAVNNHFDAVVCMYHDQGLIPFKLIHFKDGVNTTLGLPIIRTSVDHGTALDIAWKGIADPTSLKEAIRMAVFQANNIKNNS